MQKFKGNSPKNARIKIDYSVIKPNVRFSYPSKKHQVQGSMFSVISMGWALLCLFSMYSLGLYQSYQKIDKLIFQKESCVKEVEAYLYYNKTNIIKDMCKVNTGNIFNDLSLNLKNNINSNIKNAFTLRQIFWDIMLFLYLFLPPFLIYFPFRKKWSNVFPKFQAFLSKKKYKKFTSADIKYNEEYKWYCEVPIFNNIIFNYNATKDFSKYLKFFEIEEHKFSFYKARKINKKKMSKKQIKKHRDKRKKKTINEFLWYARFYFKERPVKGYLDVIFK